MGAAGPTGRPRPAVVLLWVVGGLFAALALWSFVIGDPATALLYLALTALWVGMAEILRRRDRR